MAMMTTYERAIQIYQVLIAAAHNRQTITYEQLGKTIEMPHFGLGNHPDHLLRYCSQNGLPPITVLVVEKGSGKPSHRMTSSTDIDADREKVFQRKWFSMRPLTVEMLKQSTSGS